MVLYLVSPGVPAGRGFAGEQFQAALIAKQLHDPVPRLLWFLTVALDRCLDYTVDTVTGHTRVALDSQETNLRILAGVTS